MHVRSFWLCLLNLLLFGRSCCRRRRRCFSSLFNANRPLPSSKKSHFQNEAKCETFVVKMSFICIIIKTHFHINGFALSLALKVRFFGNGLATADSVRKDYRGLKILLPWEHDLTLLHSTAKNCFPHYPHH